MKIFTFCFLLLTVRPVLPAYAQEDPGARDHHALMYDQDRDRVVLAGGNDINNEGRYIWNPTTWEWDGQHWEQVDEGTPGNISSMGMVFDQASGQSIIIGGVSPEKGDLDEIWQWNGSEWQVFDGEGPGLRMSSAIAFDEKRQEVVLFSGCVANNYPADTWIFKESTWEKVAESGPSGVCRGAMYYDPVKERTVLFGGALSSPRSRTNQMWEWDGEQWEEVDQGTLKPSPRANMYIVYDANRSRAVLYGGATEEGVSEELWEWDGTRWHQVQQHDVWPGPREVYGLVYHTRLEKVLLYGGRTGFAEPVSDFWSWDGRRWERID